MEEKKTEHPCIRQTEARACACSIRQLAQDKDTYPYVTMHGKLMRDYCESAPPPFETPIKEDRC